ncbi:MAG: hypothetical protein IKC46_14140 [Lachnospiraceae bacterium]|nr:hypothetical protein [Lachnospiraceae bacterium]
MFKNLGAVDNLFANPDSRFRGAPFWAWNTTLDKDQIRRQIGYLKEMGMGGFHMHSRTGMNTAYMSEEFLDMAAFCVEEARKNGMYAYLYDEDRWPSGAAGGHVTKDEQYRARFLVLTPVSNEDRVQGAKNYSSSAHAAASGNGRLVAAYRIELTNGYLTGYERLDITKELPADSWYVYLETTAENPWYNNQTYVDTLNPEAIKRFVEETHVKYKEKLGEDFGGIVPSIFTDEPQFSHKTMLGKADDKADVVLPYTESFEETYVNLYGESFFDRLPEIIWELPEGQGHTVRYRYHNALAEQFASAFADTVGSWCKENGIKLTGHMMEEPTLTSQTAALGEAMRSYRSFQYPGIDMLCDWREYTTAKQAQSASHQYGCGGVLSELYGVTNWDFDFRRHKLQGDWQAALGITLRVPHLSWMSMEGEAKRDYPASIFYQSPWYKEYKQIEDHYARINTVLMNGTPDVKIGVIHPIESFWMHFGPSEQTGAIREVMEKHFAELTDWLLFDHLDFDFISESLLPEQYHETEGKTFGIGQMNYDVVLVPACETIRATTLEALQAFAKKGGKVIVIGEIPTCLDGEINEKAASLADVAQQIPFEKTAISAALEAFRGISVRNEKGQEAASWLCQSRKVDGDDWLFIANGREQKNADIPWNEELTVRKSGKWNVYLYNTMNGTVAVPEVVYKNAATDVILDAWEHDSFLLRFVPEGKEISVAVNGEAKAPRAVSTKILKQPEGFALSEPNVLLLDQMEWRLDGGQWQERNETLLADDEIRGILGYPQRMEAVAQPWTIEKKAPEHLVECRYIIRSEIDVNSAYLALEKKDDWEVSVNGNAVCMEDCGYFVDECIRKVALPAMAAGENEIVVKVPYGEKTDLEWCYLLGEFGVRVEGDDACLTESPAKLFYGDYSYQGLPFYAGNVEYQFTITTEEGRYGLCISKFRNPLLKVFVDGRDCGAIIGAPYTADLGVLSAGEHKVTVCAYGNRVNAFGQVHNCDEQLKWYGPNSWRSQGFAYVKEYQLRRMGILKTPELVKYEVQ